MKGEILTQCSHGGKFDIRNRLMQHIDQNLADIVELRRFGFSQKIWRSNPSAVLKGEKCRHERETTSTPGAATGNGEPCWPRCRIGSLGRAVSAMNFHTFCGSSNHG